MRLGRTNGLDACYQHWTLATEKLTWTSVCRLHQGPSMRTNGFCVTKNNSLNSRIKFFDSVVTSVVRFGAGQRKLYKSELRKLDVHCRKLLRQVVGPPGNIDWTQLTREYSSFSLCYKPLLKYHKVRHKYYSTSTTPQVLLQIYLLLQSIAR